MGTEPGLVMVGKPGVTTPGIELTDEPNELEPPSDVGGSLESELLLVLVELETPEKSLLEGSIELLVLLGPLGSEFRVDIEEVDDSEEEDSMSDELDLESLLELEAGSLGSELVEEAESTEESEELEVEESLVGSETLEVEVSVEVVEVELVSEVDSVLEVELGSKLEDVLLLISGHWRSFL